MVLVVLEVAMARGVAVIEQTINVHNNQSKQMFAGDLLYIQTFDFVFIMENRGIKGRLFHLQSIN